MLNTQPLLYGYTTILPISYYWEIQLFLSFCAYKQRCGDYDFTCNLYLSEDGRIAQYL